MTIPKTGRMQNQDNWKRTQVRMPPEQYEVIAKYASDKDISLNTAMIELMELGYSSFSHIAPDEIECKIIHLQNGMKRIVYGKMLNAFDVDFTQDLTSLKEDIELSLEFLKKTKLKMRLAFMTKDIFVYQGANHLDIVNNGVGSLNWLIVEDHYVNPPE